VSNLELIPTAGCLWYYFIVRYGAVRCGAVRSILEYYYSKRCKFLGRATKFSAGPNHVEKVHTLLLMIFGVLPATLNLFLPSALKVRAAPTFYF
jgi:hypothetical protein